LTIAPAEVLRVFSHFAPRKGPRCGAPERIGIMGAVADLELILQSLFGSESSGNTGISPGFTLGSEKKLLFTDCLAEGEGFELTVLFEFFEGA